MLREFEAEYAWSEENGYIYGDSHDTGNGALFTWGRSRNFPNVVAIMFFSYCGREKHSLHYEVDGDPSRRKFGTAAAAQHSSGHVSASGRLRCVPTAVLVAELDARKGR